MSISCSEPVSRKRSCIGVEDREISVASALGTVWFSSWISGRLTHFCWELALETWTKSSSINCLGVLVLCPDPAPHEGEEEWGVGSEHETITIGVHDLGHVHSLASLQWSGLSDQPTLLLTEKCLLCQKWSPYKRRAMVSMFVCAKKKRNGPASADQGLSTASQDSHHVHNMLWLCPPTSPYPTLFVKSKTYL